MRLRGHAGLWLATLAALPLVADLPGWMLWTPLAAWVALMVVLGVRLPGWRAPAVGFLGMTALALARVPWTWSGFALALTVGALTMAFAMRARMRPGLAVLLAAAPLLAWVAGYFTGPGHATVEAALRAELLTELGRRVPFDPRLGLTPQAFRALLERGADTVVLLMPAFCLLQAPPLMAWGYSMARAALQGSAHEPAPLTRFPLLRVPDAAVWVLSLGILLLVTRQAAVYRAGANVVAVMAAAYFLQGLSVMTFLALAVRVWWLAGAAVLAVWLLLLSPLFSVFACVLGLSDVWLDFRKIQARPRTGPR
ncbi:MAG: DUF2232 domain-containing protein [Candidatus Eisenbacteria bacterium]|nr:DUF2232 domain-containing protein [Candidatus Eisenbacteria bacterium]